MAWIDKARSPKAPTAMDQILLVAGITFQTKTGETLILTARETRYA